MFDRLTGVVRISNRDADLDAERVREGAQSRFWELAAEQIQKMIHSEHVKLESSADDREIAQAQGAVRALRKVLTLPDALQKEKS